jgi:Single-strand binding protein family
VPPGTTSRCTWSLPPRIAVFPMVWNGSTRSTPAVDPAGCTTSAPYSPRAIPSRPCWCVWYQKVPGCSARKRHPARGPPLYHSGIARTPALMLINGLHIRIIHATAVEIIRLVDRLQSVGKDFKDVATIFFSASVWEEDGAAEVAELGLTKGSRVSVDGLWSKRTWTTKEGERRVTDVLTVSKVRLFTETGSRSS